MESDHMFLCGIMYMWSLFCCGLLLRFFLFHGGSWHPPVCFEQAGGLNYGLFSRLLIRKDTYSATFFLSSSVRRSPLKYKGPVSARTAKSLSAFPVSSPTIKSTDTPNTSAIRFNVLIDGSRRPFSKLAMVEGCRSTCLASSRTVHLRSSRSCRKRRAISFLCDSGTLENM